ncbi:MAG: MFS transporter [Thermogemmatispora sp.]|uniref:MFS transporter n=1 Tax=Thermogemmatispora sp. TaxID=1968838 RepID=UPI00260ECFAC|nr:MFS transporter [Thermogemmatispora sp.]MBX5455441.1 MFS transporter [Thermogemmatispora sp.]
MEIGKDSGEVAMSAAATAELPSRRVSLLEHININVFWFANNFHWQALLAIVIPSMVAKFLPVSQEAINLTTVVLWGTIVAVIVNPLVGAISDYATFRLGRRRPFMIIGTVFNIIVLVAFAFAPGWASSTALLALFAALFILLQITNNVANSPWSAIIADKVPQSQRGLAAGFNGLLSLLGTAVGSLVAGAIVNKHDPLPVYRQEIVQIFLLIAAVQIIFVAYTVLTVKETPLPMTGQERFSFRRFIRRFLFNPLHYPDMAWVLLARLLVMMGIWTVYYFLQYYFDNVLGGPGVRTIIYNTPFSGEFFNGLVFQPALLLTALLTSIVGGWASDHWGRKGLVYLSGTMMAIVCLVFIFFQTQYGAFVAALIFGIGFGAYTSVDWALTTDVLPPTNEAGKFMGFWSMMGILPQVIGTAIGGVILQLLQSLPNHLGYTVLFAVTTLYFAIGTLAIKQVRGAR